MSWSGPDFNSPWPVARGWIVANIWGGVLGSDTGSDVSDDDGDSAGVDVDEAKRFWQGGSILLNLCCVFHGEPCNSWTY